MRQARKVLGWMQTALWLIVLAGAVLHATVRDGLDALAWLFYALPLPLLALATLVLALWPFARGLHRIVAGLCCIGLGGVWVSRSWCRGPAPDGHATPMEEVKVLCWNIGRPETPSWELIALVKKHAPDIVGIVEPGRDAMNHRATYEEHLPDYDCQVMPRGLIVLTRWPARMRARGKLDGIGAYANFDVTLPHRGFRLVLVDVHADPLMLRKPSLDEALAHGNHDPQCIIMGDFNTPLESVHFAPYRAAKMQDAFATAGRGFRETWFWGLPVLSLDHVWCGPSWKVVEARKIRDGSSDHDALLVTLR